MTRLRRVARNVSDLARMRAFYTEVLGFSQVGPVIEDTELADALRIKNIYCVSMMLGSEILELTACTPPGAPYPAECTANATYFQHIALITTDILATYARALRAGVQPISQGGPQRLPAEAGGARAWKFRDPDGHPLELLQLPENGKWHGNGEILGYDHSAISVRDTPSSIKFYESIGLQVRHSHLNKGPAQVRLDALPNAEVEVVGMGNAAGPPYIELLGYRGTAKHELSYIQPNDIAADRLVFATEANELSWMFDPDGHVVVMDGRMKPR